jgi:hypothetical protein
MLYLCFILEANTSFSALVIMNEDTQEGFAEHHKIIGLHGNVL